MLIEQKFQVISLKKGKYDEESKKFKKDRIYGIITPMLIDLNKNLINQDSDDVLMFDCYTNRIEKEIKPGVLYSGKFELPRFAQGDVVVRLIEVL